MVVVVCIPPLTLLWLLGFDSPRPIRPDLEDVTMFTVVGITDNDVIEVPVRAAAAVADVVSCALLLLLLPLLHPATGTAIKLCVLLSLSAKC